MVNAISACLLAFGALGHLSDTEPDPETTRAVSSALGKGSYPWYDSQKDAVKPIALPEEEKPIRFPNYNLGFLGNVISVVGFLLALAALIAVLAWFWKIYEPSGEDLPQSSRGRGEPSRVEALPEGMRRQFESSDPWEEALRRRARGDLAGAVVCLFAHQLLTLSRLGLVRLAPGRTGRQLLRAVADADFRGLAQPTLRQFEAVYYGHRTPSTEEFAVVWQSAEAFERRVAGGVVA
jgi:Domain of unknown function (DUF4129)